MPLAVVASDPRSLVRWGVAVGGLAGGSLVALVLALGGSDVRTLVDLAGLAAMAVPVAVSTALAGGISGWLIGSRGASKGAVWTASVFGVLATVPSQAFALVIGAPLGGSWGEQLLGGRLGVWMGMSAGMVVVATPMIVAAAVAGGIVGARLGRGVGPSRCDELPHP